MITRALHWIAQKLIGPDFTIMEAQLADDLWLMAAHRDADARLELEGGEGFDIHFDRTAN